MVSLLGSSHFVEERDIYIPSYNGIEQNLQKIAKYKPRKNDYILCSYPKSGTHWVNEVMTMLVSGEAIYRCDAMNNMESGNFSDYPAEQNRVLQTHLPYDMLPSSILQGKIVYVMRDPRDQLVSLYYHHQGLKGSPTLTFAQFYKDVMENPHKVDYGSWFRNAYQWWLQFKFCQNVLFIFYEDLLADPQGEILRIVRFYDLNHITEEFVAKICEKTEFSQMKLKPVPDWFSDKHNENFSIYRKGCIGNWQVHFTPEMVECLRDLSSPMERDYQLPLHMHNHQAKDIMLRYDCSNRLDGRNQEPLKAF